MNWKKRKPASGVIEMSWSRNWPNCMCMCDVCWVRFQYFVCHLLALPCLLFVRGLNLPVIWKIENIDFALRLFAMTPPVLVLVAFDRLVSLRIGLVCVVQGNFKLIDVLKFWWKHKRARKKSSDRLELLLDPESLRLGASFCLKGGLHWVQGSSVVLPEKYSRWNLLNRNLKKET